MKNSIFFSAMVTLLVSILELYVYLHMETAKKYKIYRLHFVAVLNIVFWFGSKWMWKSLTTECSNILFSKFVNYIWKGILLLYFLCAHTAYLSNYLCQKEATYIGLITWTCFGAYIILFSHLFILHLCGNVLRRIRPNTNIPFISKSQYRSLIAVVSTIIITLYSYIQARQPPVIYREVIPIKHLPQSMNGTRLVLLADIHLGPTVGKAELQRLVEKTNALNADIIVMAGDLVDGVLEDLREAAEPIEDLKAEHGLFFSTGNHEYYTGDVENWLEFIKQKGFHILHNSNKKVYSWKSQDKNDWICFLGTDDIQADQISYTGHGMNLTKAYEGCNANHPAILSAHQPKAAKAALDSQYSIQLVLAGHTHGGQIYPIIWFASLVNPFMQGLYEYRKLQYVYVTQGSVYYGFPMRFGTVPEITELILVNV